MSIAIMSALAREDVKVEPAAAALFSEWPQVALLLPNLSQRLRECFGGDASIRVEAFTDTEYPSEKQLVLVARTELDPQVADELLDKFLRDYWVDIPHEARASLGASVDFI